MKFENHCIIQTDLTFSELGSYLISWGAFIIFFSILLLLNYYEVI